MSKILIVGGGAAGMFAAVMAAKNGHEVHVYERNEKLGKKLYITGKGRCNLTNAADPEELLQNVVTNRKFLYSAFYGCDSDAVIRFFEAAGLPLKTERGNRVFPVSDHSSDVIGALQRQMKKYRVQVHLNARVEHLIIEETQCRGIYLAPGPDSSADRAQYGDRVIVATGGLSYPVTGSSGDGFSLAREAGHKVTALYPALVPLTASEDYIPELQGLSLRNVEIVIKDGKKEKYRAFGEMLFTHYGVSGPVILSASSHLIKDLDQKELDLQIDLKPALSEEQLDRRLLKDFDKFQNKQFKNALGDLLPVKLIPVIVRLSNIMPEKKVNEITKSERLTLVTLLKKFPVTLNGYRGFSEAVITRGGVSVKEIDPATMASKYVSGLYFIGEVLDLDALTGGFNLQIAWSTAYAAANAE